MNQRNQLITRIQLTENQLVYQKNELRRHRLYLKHAAEHYRFILGVAIPITFLVSWKLRSVVPVRRWLIKCVNVGLLLSKLTRIKF